MKVVVASRNPVKVGATTQAFKTLFPDVVLDVISKPFSLVDIRRAVGQALRSTPPIHMRESA